MLQLTRLRVQVLRHLNWQKLLKTCFLIASWTNFWNQNSYIICQFDSWNSLGTKINYLLFKASIISLLRPQGNNGRMKSDCKWQSEHMHVDHINYSIPLAVQRKMYHSLKNTQDHRCHWHSDTYEECKMNCIKKCFHQLTRKQPSLTWKRLCIEQMTHNSIC